MLLAYFWNEILSGLENKSSCSTKINSVMYIEINCELDSTGRDNIYQVAFLLNWAGLEKWNVTQFSSKSTGGKKHFSFPGK